MNHEEMIHKRIGEVIAKSGLTLKDVSERTGIPCGRIERLLKDRLPMGREIVALATLFQVSTDYLLAID